MGLMDKLKDGGLKDKLKDAGKGALKGVMIMGAKSYATVTSGKHKLCKISLNTTYDKIVFIKVAAIEKEYDIKDSIKTFSLYSLSKSPSFSLKLFFNDGETSDALIMIDEKRGNALPTPEQRLAAQYSDMSDFIKALAKNVPELDEEMKKTTNLIMRYAGKEDIF